MSKIAINNVSAQGIIFPVSDPGELFLEIKDNFYPVKVFRRNLCLIGGNWIGAQALNDHSSRDTFIREMNEELSLDRPIASTLELNSLIDSDIKTYITPRNDVIATPEDYDILDKIKKEIATAAEPYADLLNFIPEAVFSSADPDNKKDGVKILTSYFCVPLRIKTWRELQQLQIKFGNLSNESVTLITSAQEIVRAGTKISWGHDHAVQKFLKDFGIAGAEQLSLVPDIESSYLGKPRLSYYDYLRRFTVLKKPEATKPLTEYHRSC